MWTMGDDFQYQYAETWFKQMDKLIHYVNKVNSYLYKHLKLVASKLYLDVTNIVERLWK